MILFSYDDLQAWVGAYAPEVAQSQFEKMAGMWEAGLEDFRSALARVPAPSAASSAEGLWHR
ncbi:MAG: hypothetical protein V9H26_21095 [Verrucomicrobiota bacterium]